MRRALACAGALLWALAAGSCRHAAPAAGATTARADSVEAAYQRHDWPAMLRAARRAVAATPTVPRALYNLACAEALDGHADGTAAAIDRLTALGVFLDLAHDDDLRGVRADARVAAALGRLGAVRARVVGHAEVAFTLAGSDWLTEGLAWDAQTGDFFVGSVHKRQILRVSADGRVRPFIAPGQDGILGVLGMTVDARRRSLWATSAGLDEVADLSPAQRGKTGIFELDLATGKLRERIELDAPGGRHHFDDLVLDGEGRLFISDGDDGAIWSLEAGGPLELWLPPGALQSPQGLAWSADGQSLFVADYARGLARIDRQSKAVHWLRSDDAALVGIDGLVRDPRDGTLVATQNGIRPLRVVRIAAAGERARVETLLMGDARMSEPTLGTIVDGNFVFVANAQWDAFARPRPGALPPPPPSPPLVLRLPLRAAGQPQ